MAPNYYQNKQVTKYLPSSNKYTKAYTPCLASHMTLALAACIEIVYLRTSKNTLNNICLESNVEVKSKRQIK